MISFWIQVLNNIQHIYIYIYINIHWTFVQLRWDCRNSSHHEHVWRSGVIAPSLLTSALDGGQWKASGPDRLTPEEREPNTLWTVDWVGRSNSSLDISSRSSARHIHFHGMMHSVCIAPWMFHWPLIEYRGLAVTQCPHKLCIIQRPLR
jgi:hypothetical protein